MNSLSIRKQSILILLFAWLTYTLSYLGRVNYSSCMIEIVYETGISRTSAGLVASVLSLAYAIGQLTIGFFINRFSSVKIITLELLIVAFINLLFPICIGKWYMFILWGINGFAQSTVLCTLTKIFTENLKEPYLSKSAVVVNTVGAIGGVLNYFLTYLFLTYTTWKMFFLFISITLFVFGILWAIVLPKITIQKEQLIFNKNTENIIKSNEIVKEETIQPFFKIFIEKAKFGVPLAILCCFFIGLLRDGVSVWIPTYINDTFGLNTKNSIISTIFVPMFQILGAFIAGYLGKKIKNLHIIVSTIFVISSICMTLLPVLGNRSLFLTLIIFVANAMSMTAAMTLYLSLFPLRIFSGGNVAIIVGISNFCNHLGDFVASTGIGWLSENSSWQLTFSILGIISFIAAIISIIGGIIYFNGSKNNVKNDN